MKHSLRPLFLTSLFLFAGCTERADDADATKSKRLSLGASATPVRVSLDARAQRITGFGASSAWTTTGVSEAQADELFTTAGLGISILRMRIAPDGSSQEVATALRAAERGALIWAAPWSPPGAWKTNGSDSNGGSLKPANYQLWASRLAAFAGGMKSRGVPLFALSVQNEPDWVAEWETCVWTPEELLKFTRDYLAPALREVSPTTKILAPESANWDDLEVFANPFFADSAALATLGIVGTHSYGGLARPYPAAAQAGKEFWETEISYEVTSDITAALGTANMIHTHLTIAQVNAWHYWWINSDSNSSLYRDGAMLPQANGFAHFARFVRPGYYRVSAEPRTPVAGVSVTAFVDPASPRTVLVAINANSASVPQSFDFGGATVGPVTPWVTTETGALVESSEITGGSNFAYDLPGTSIVTFVTSRPFEASGGGGQTGTGGSASAAGGASSSDGGAAGSAGEAGERGEASFGGTFNGLGGSLGRGGATSAAGGKRASNGGAGARAGGAPGSGGSALAGGGTTAQGGMTHAGGVGGNATPGKLPEEPFLPGCYCAAVPAPTSRAPLWPALIGVLASLRRFGRSRRRASASR